MDGFRVLKRLRTSFLFIFLCTGCAHIYTAHGVYYRVQKGDTLAGVAKKHRISLQELAEINNIEQEQEVKPGRSLYIPGVTPNGFARIIEKEGHYKKSRHRSRVTEASASRRIEADHGRFVWPVEGEISSIFGMRHGRRHDGLDIRAKRGTIVIASADGEVVYSKRMRGYGNLVLLRHPDDFFTVYAHNSVNLVKKGKQVKRGEPIAKVGQTGRATGPHVHFEVREGTKPRNPLFFLPKKDRVTAGQEKEVPDDESEE